MASRLTPWIAAALLGCAAVTAFLLPPHGDVLQRYRRPSESSPTEAALSRTERQLWDARELLRQRALRDSLVEMVRRTAVHSGISVPVVVAHDSAVGMQEVLKDMLAGPWSQARGDDSTWTAIALASESGYWWSGRSMFFLPDATDGRLCIAVDFEGLRVVTPERYSSNRGSAGTMLGPCAYYSAFGHPGAQIALWLSDNHHIVALRPTWTVNPELPPLSQRSALLGELKRDDLLALRSDLVACARGQAAACLDLFTNPGRGFGRTIPGAVNGPNRRWYPVWEALNQREALLSDMIADFGRERFAAFWRSEARVPEAFEQAMGVPIETWMEAWALANIGPPPSRTPIPWGSVIFGVLLAALAVGGSAAYSTRRQMG